MRLLIIADYVPPGINIEQILIKEDIDVICLLGDLTVEQLSSLSRINKPKIGIYGNHCKGEYLEEIGCLNAHRTIEEINGISFIGFEGSIGNKDNRRIYTQDRYNEIFDGSNPYADIVLSHAPPYGINDEEGSETHAGIKGLRNYIDRNSPRLVLHGHTYPSKEQEISIYKNSVIVYTHGIRVFDTSVDLINLPEATNYLPDLVTGFWD